MASRVQKIMFWDTFKNAKSVILHYFPVAEIGSNIHLLYFSYPQEIWAQFVEWGKKVLSPYRPHWSVYFSVSLLQIAGKHPVIILCRLHCIDEFMWLSWRCDGLIANSKLRSSRYICPVAVTAACCHPRHTACLVPIAIMGLPRAPAQS